MCERESARERAREMKNARERDSEKARERESSLVRKGSGYMYNERKRSTRERVSLCERERERDSCIYIRDETNTLSYCKYVVTHKHWGV